MDLQIHLAKFENTSLQVQMNTIEMKKKSIFQKSSDISKNHGTLMKTFQCDICEINLNENSSVNRHKKIVHEKQRLHNCQICTSKFGYN